MPLRRLASPELVADAARANARMDKTLTCHVLSDGEGGHAFCSRYDLGPWPLLSEVRGVDDDAARSLGRASAVFVNGFVFDELRPSAVRSAVAIAKANGAKVYFDPGPRAFTFRGADAERVLPPAALTEARVRTEHRVPATRRGTAPLGRARLRSGRRH